MCIVLFLYMCAAAALDPFFCVSLDEKEAAAVAAHR